MSLAVDVGKPGPKQRQRVCTEAHARIRPSCSRVVTMMGLPRASFAPSKRKRGREDDGEKAKNCSHLNSFTRSTTETASEAQGAPHLISTSPSRHVEEATDRIDFGSIESTTAIERLSMRPALLWLRSLENARASLRRAGLSSFGVVVVVVVFKCPCFDRQPIGIMSRLAWRVWRRHLVGCIDSLPPLNQWASAEVFGGLGRAWTDGRGDGRPSLLAPSSFARQ